MTDQYSDRDQYSDAVAEHYAAYRPPLHRLILERTLGDLSAASTGVDVGCGTGRSSVALAHFCEHVYGIDPSQAMLDSAEVHPKVEYRLGQAANLPLADDSVEVATFAGSLFYADTDETVAELTRVCRPSALIIVYDFDVLIDGTLQRFGIANSAHESTYNHRENFSGVPVFRELAVVEESIELGTTTADLAHVLLADAERHSAFVERYETHAPHDELVRELGGSDRTNTIEAKLYFSKYQLATS